MTAMMHTATSPRTGLPRLAAAAWALNAAVLAWAALSLAGWQFVRWIDLRTLDRFLGPWASPALLVAWALSVLAYSWCAGPQPALFARGWVRRRPVPFCRRLLWPTYLILVVLALNTGWFYRHWWVGNIEGFPLPMCLLVLGLLALWIRLARRWVASDISLPPRLPARTQVFAAAWLVAILALFGGFFLLHLQERPPPQPVDLGVVFGFFMREDGTAGRVLEQRTRAGIELYKQKRIRLLMLSGGTGPTIHGPQSEAQAMEKVCRDAGLPPEALILDPGGFNSRATVLNTARILAQRNLHGVVAISSDYHLARIRQTYRAAGIPVYTVASRPDLWLQADPLADLREAVGMIVYACFPGYRKAQVSVMTVQQPRLVVSKSQNILELYDGSRLVKTYHCITGSNPGDKQIEGDRKTPLGRFRIVYKNPDSKFHLSLGLDYPRPEDARRGLDAGLITPAEFDQIVSAHQNGGIPNWYTGLGGEIFIHGHGEGRTGTAGCVALSNPEIEELYAICDLGTPVEIHP